jgi:hypothetical protein
VVAECARRRADNLDPQHTRPGEIGLLSAGIHGRLGDLASQGAETLAQTPAVINQAPKEIQKTAGVRQAAAEPDGAETPAAAEPE